MNQLDEFHAKFDDPITDRETRALYLKQEDERILIGEYHYSVDQMSSELAITLVLNAANNQMDKLMKECGDIGVQPEVFNCRINGTPKFSVTVCDQTDMIEWLLGFEFGFVDNRWVLLDK